MLLLLLLLVRRLLLGNWKSKCTLENTTLCPVFMFVVKASKTHFMQKYWRGELFWHTLCLYVNVDYLMTFPWQIWLHSAVRGAHGAARPGDSVQHFAAQHDPGVGRSADGEPRGTSEPRVRTSLRAHPQQHSYHLPERHLEPYPTLCARYATYFKVWQ